MTDELDPVPADQDLTNVSVPPPAQSEDPNASFPADGGAGDPGTASVPTDAGAGGPGDAGAGDAGAGDAGTGGGGVSGPQPISEEEMKDWEGTTQTHHAIVHGIEGAADYLTHGVTGAAEAVWYGGSTVYDVATGASNEEIADDATHFAEASLAVGTHGISHGVEAVVDLAAGEGAGLDPAHDFLRDSIVKPAIDYVSPELNPDEPVTIDRPASLPGMEDVPASDNPGMSVDPESGDLSGGEPNMSVDPEASDPGMSVDTGASDGGMSVDPGVSEEDPAQFSSE